MLNLRAHNWLKWPNGSLPALELTSQLTLQLLNMNHCKLSGVKQLLADHIKNMTLIKHKTYVTESSCWNYQSPWTAAQSEACSKELLPLRSNCSAEIMTWILIRQNAFAALSLKCTSNLWQTMTIKRRLHFPNKDYWVSLVINRGIAVSKGTYFILNFHPSGHDAQILAPCTQSIK